MPQFILVEHRAGNGWSVLEEDQQYFTNADSARDYARQRIEANPKLVLSIAKVVKRVSCTVSVREADVE